MTTLLKNLSLQIITLNCGFLLNSQSFGMAKYSQNFRQFAQKTQSYIGNSNSKNSFKNTDFKQVSKTDVSLKFNKIFTTFNQPSLTQKSVKNSTIKKVPQEQQKSWLSWVLAAVGGSFIVNAQEQNIQEDGNDPQFKDVIEKINKYYEEFSEVLPINNELENKIDALISWHSGQKFLLSLFETNPEAMLLIKNYELLFDEARYSEELLKIIKQMMEYNPSCIQEFTEVGIRKFDQIVAGYHLNFYDELFKKNPDAARQLVPFVIKNFKPFVDDFGHYGTSFLFNLTNAYPQAAIEMTDSIVNNFEHIVTLKLSCHDFLIPFIIHNPKAIPLLEKKFESNIEQLLVFSGSLSFIEKVIELNPQSYDLFHEITLTHINAIIKKEWGFEFINKILKQSKQPEQFESYALDHFEDIVQSGKGLNFIIKVIELNPQSIDSFHELTIKNFHTISKIYSSFTFFGEILKRSKKSEQFESYALEQFNYIVQSKRSVGFKFLMTFLEKHPEKAILFNELIYKNFDSLIENILELRIVDNGTLSFLSTFIEKNPQSLVLLNKKIEENFDRLIGSDNGIQLLGCIAKHHFDREFHAKVVKQKQLNAYQFFKLAQANPCDPYVKEFVKAKDANSLDQFLEVFNYFSTCPTEKNDVQLKTSTERHLAYNFILTNDSIFYDYIFKNFLKVPELLKMANDVNKKQNELETQNYYTFVHGQRKEYLFPEIIYTALYQLKHDISRNDFLFAHIKKPFVDYPESEQLIHKQLLEGTHQNARDKVQFLNGALFGNSSNFGSSSAYYIKSNQNVSNLNFDIKQIFAYFGYEKLYEQHKEQIHKLESDYRNATKYGNLLLFAVPKETIQHTIIPVRWDGLKQSYSIHSAKNPQGFKSSNNIQKIMKIYHKKHHKLVNSDNIEFGGIMTQSPGSLMDINSKNKVFYFMACDEETNKNLDNKFKDLENIFRKELNK